MTTSTSSISRTVMLRVRTIHMLRPLLSSVALASFLFVFAVWGIGREVWVSHVFQNMPSAENITAVLRFLVSAFVNTRFIVQALSIIAIGAFIWALREIARGIRVMRFA